jgi:hypothetical protein
MRVIPNEVRDLPLIFANPIFDAALPGIRSGFSEIDFRRSSWPPSPLRADFLP